MPRNTAKTRARVRGVARRVASTSLVLPELAKRIGTPTLLSLATRPRSRALGAGIQTLVRDAQIVAALRDDWRTARNGVRAARNGVRAARNGVRSAVRSARNGVKSARNGVRAARAGARSAVGRVRAVGRPRMTRATARRVYDSIRTIMSPGV